MRLFTLPTALFSGILSAFPLAALAHVRRTAEGAVILHDHGSSVGDVTPNAAAILLGVSGDPGQLLVALGVTIVTLALVYLLSLMWKERRDQRGDSEVISPGEAHRRHVRFLAGGTLVAIFVFILAGRTAVVAFLTLALILFGLWHALHSYFSTAPSH